MTHAPPVVALRESMAIRQPSPIQCTSSNGRASCAARAVAPRRGAASSRDRSVASMKSACNETASARPHGHVPLLARSRSQPGLALDSAIRVLPMRARCSTVQTDGATPSRSRGTRATLFAEHLGLRDLEGNPATREFFLGAESVCRRVGARHPDSMLVRALAATRRKAESPSSAHALSTAQRREPDFRNCGGRFATIDGMWLRRCASSFPRSARLSASCQSR